MSKIICWTIVIAGTLTLTIIIWYLIGGAINIANKSLKNTSEPISQSNKVTTVVYNSAGVISYKIMGNNIKYFADTQVTWFIKPVAVMFNEHKIPSWTAEANQAKLTNDRMLYLYGHVQMNNLLDTSYLKHIKTKNMLVNLVTQDILSDGEVILYGNNFSSTGMKLRGSLSKQTAELSDRVKTIYANKKP